MKIREITDDDWLKITDLENMFDVYRKPNGDYSYNLNETVYVDIDDSQLLEYVCDCRMHWPLASYKIYGTTRLAWLLMKINGVQAMDMFKALSPPDVIKYVDKDCLQVIVKGINDYDQY